jgi:hypothetical protein
MSAHIFRPDVLGAKPSISEAGVYEPGFPEVSAFQGFEQKMSDATR